MKACYKISLSGVFALLFCGIVQAKEALQIQKILLNQVPVVDAQSNRIELGSLILYFSEKPVIHTLPQEKNGANKVVFFIPQAEIKDPALRKIVTKLYKDESKISKGKLTNSDRGNEPPVFRVMFEEVMYPVKGVKLTVLCNPDKVAYTYDTFDSISLSPGVAFTFYNRSALQHLASKSADKGLLRVACCEKKKTIVLDCGHGGSDKGAAPFKGIEEKNITLSVGLKVADLLKKKGIAVVLTRSHDATRSLDERSQIALNHRPELFVSLHANSSLKPTAQGIETFYVHQSLLHRIKDTLRAEEGLTINTLVADRCRESASCAQAVHEHLVAAAAKKNGTLIDRGLKQSLSSVLLGAQTPGLLVEMGFVSHPAESRLLINRDYQECLAKGISEGIVAALDRVNA